MRRDLTAGSIETWLHRPGFNLGVSSAYGSQVLVSVEKPGFYGFVLVTGPSSAVSLNFSGDYRNNPWQATANAGLGFADQHGIWLGGDAIYLYTPQSGLRKIAAVPGYPTNGCV